MGKLWVLIGAGLLITACDRDAKIFGHSHDECILKNASIGGDEGSRQRATEVCERHFKRRPNAAEQEQVRFDVKQIHTDEPVGFDFEPPDRVAVEVSNQGQDFAVTQVEVAMDFYKESPWKVPDQTPVDTLTWTMDVSTQPNADETVTGTFRAGKPPAPFGKLLYAKPTMILPLN